MHKLSHTLLVVNPLISATYLSKTLRNLNFKLIAVYNLSNFSDEEVDARFQPRLFDESYQIRSEAELPEIINKLKAYHFDFIFYGSDNAVHLGDLIAKELNFTPRNFLETSSFRSDKYQMQEALKLAGLSAIQQIHLKTQPSSEEIKILNSWDFPWIVKPTNAAGARGVQLIHNLDELNTYLMNPKTYFLGSAIQDYLVQKCLEGIEYYVDSFSAEGVHHIVSIGSYVKYKLNGRKIYRKIRSVDRDSNEFKACANFITQVLSAVGLNNGFGHSEMFLTSKGPRLVEVNPRVSGFEGMANRMSKLVHGYTQLDFLYNYLQGLPSPEVHEGPKIYGGFYLLQALEPQLIKHLNVEKLNQLSSYREHQLLKKLPFDVKHPPQDLFDTMCYVLMSHSDKAVLEADTLALEQMEKNNELFS